MSDTPKAVMLMGIDEALGRDGAATLIRRVLDMRVMIESITAGDFPRQWSHDARAP